MTSFLGLVLTGMPLKYSETDIVLYLTRFVSVHGLGFIHRICAVMTFGYFFFYLLHVGYRILIKKEKSLLWGPDSMIPQPEDLRLIVKQFRWFFFLGEKPQFDHWAYWEKFDYWAVFWGMPLLAITGLMLMYPLLTSRVLPGWTLNVVALLHRAEAILAISYIFIVHFFIGHLRPSSFPMNEAMFLGTVPLEEAMEEKPRWVERLKKEGKLELANPKPPARWYRITYFVFGYMAIGFGIYLLINGIIYSRYIRLH